MNHPTREEWMAYLYHETPRSGVPALEQHLESCAACRKEISEWQLAMRGLEAWKLPRRSPGFGWVAPMLKWGIAALFAVGLGYGFGRFSTPAVDVETLRAGIENSLRTSLAQEIASQAKQQTAAEMKAAWANFQAQWLDRMEELAVTTAADSSEQTRRILSAYDTALATLNSRLAQQATDLAALRKDTETVALYTEYGFRRNQAEMVRLASYTQPARPPLDGARPQLDP